MIIFGSVSSSVALSNLKFMKELNKNEKFAKLTGG